MYVYKYVCKWDQHSHWIPVCMYEYVCMYMYVCICMYVCMYISMYVCICMYICMYISMYVCKLDQHSHWMPVCMSSIQDPKHPLIGADPDSHTNLNVESAGYQPKGEDDCGYLAQYNQAYSRRVGLDSLGRLSTLLTHSSSPRRLAHEATVRVLHLARSAAALEAM